MLALVAALSSVAAWGASKHPAQRLVPAGPLLKHISQGAIPLPPEIGDRRTTRGLAVDAAGNIYVAVDRLFAPEVAVLSADGRLLRTWSSRAGALPAGYSAAGSAPTLLAVGPDGLVYLQNSNESFVRVYTPEGALVRAFGRGEVSSNASGDIEVDAAGNVFVATRAPGGGDDVVVRFDPAGNVTGRLIPRPGQGSDEALSGIAVAPDGSVWVAVPTGHAGPRLIHLAADGRALGDAPVLEVLVPGFSPQDVAIAGGRLFLTGIPSRRFPSALVVVGVDGVLNDRVGSGAGRAVAVQGKDVYALGIVTRAAGIRSQQAADEGIAWLKGEPLAVIPRPGNSEVQGLDRKGRCFGGSLRSDLNVPLVSINTDEQGGLERGECDFVIENVRNPCGVGGRVLSGDIFVDGAPLDDVRETLSIDLTNPARPRIEIDPFDVGEGSIVVRWQCDHPQGPKPVFEWKGEIDLIDPSGNVLDASTGRPVEAARVRLEFSPVRRGPFGVPSPRGYTPQVNPQITGRSGAFAWDVAPGFWRLRIAAFGYRPYTSPRYRVPPPVTGLRLRLRQRPAQQRLIIDPRAGRVGSVRLGARLGAGTPRGLRVRVVGRRVQGIAILGRRFRTAHGIRRGSGERALRAAYPAIGRRVVRHRVGKATFTVRRGRVTAIRLGR